MSDPSMQAMIQRAHQEYERLGCRLWYVDNPHPSWFGSRPMHTTATGMSEVSELSPYTTAESRHLKTKFYWNYSLQDNEHMHRGRGQELHILQTFCQRNGYHLLQVALLINQQDVRLAATPDGLAMACVLKGPERRPEFLLFDLEAKCPIKEVELPPLMYLAQMAAQLEVVELQRAYLITHSTTSAGRCWQMERTRSFFGWLRQCAHRGLQYDACGLSHCGGEWSSRGLRGFMRTQRRREAATRAMFPGLYDQSNEKLTRRLDAQNSGGQTLLSEHFVSSRAPGRQSLDQPLAVAPLPQVTVSDRYEAALLKLPEFKPPA